MLKISSLKNDLNNLKIDANKHLEGLENRTEIMEQYKNTIRNIKKEANRYKQDFNIDFLYHRVSANAKSKMQQNAAILQIGIYALAYDDLELNGW
jgi:acyl-CoA hydrolase